MDLDKLKQESGLCNLCSLHKDRVISVFAKGNPEADIMVCGMCPGPDENALENVEGHPFVGRAGKFLDTMLEDVGLSLDTVYVTNLVKCFVKPGIHLDEEWITRCVPYFISQIAIIKPKVIVSLGGDVSSFLLSVNKGVSVREMRKGEHSYLNIPLIPTYHPSYYIRGGYKKHKNYSKGVDDFNKAKLKINT